MVANKLRVLLVETSLEDAQRTLAKLEESGYEVEHRRVDNASAMQAALIENEWDVVLCSYDLSGFCGLAALELMQSKNWTFLFYSCRMTCMKKPSSIPCNPVRTIIF